MKIDYPKMYTKVYKNTALCQLLRTLSAFCVIASVVSVILSLTLSFLGGGILAAVRLGAVLLIPFILVSAARRIVNLKRPCEVFDLDALGIDTRGFKRGKSFPSRHVFSGFLIATVLLPEIPALGILLLVLSLLLGVSRVALGIHFVRDTVAGAILGVASALLGLLIIGI